MRFGGHPQTRAAAPEVAAWRLTFALPQCGRSVMQIRIALVVLLLLPSVASAQARIALLIGNQGYAANVGRLKNQHSDVLLISAALRSLGFKVPRKDADYRSTDAAIKRHIAMVRREGQGAISLVYYSGHGGAGPGHEDQLADPRRRRQRGRPRTLQLLYQPQHARGEPAHPGARRDAPRRI